MKTLYPTATTRPDTRREDADRTASHLALVHGVGYAVHVLPDGRFRLVPDTTTR